VPGGGATGAPAAGATLAGVRNGSSCVFDVSIELGDVVVRNRLGERERTDAALILPVGIRTGSPQYDNHRTVSPVIESGGTQRGIPVPILKVNDRTMRDEASRDLLGAGLCCEMEWCPAALVLKIHVRASGHELFDGSKITVACCIVQFRSAHPV